MPRKYLRQLFNQRHTKCQYCERSTINGVINGGVRHAKVKALFHPRPWMGLAQCSHRLINNKWNQFTQRFANMAEEIEELERVRTRLEEERLHVRRARKNVLRLSKKFVAQTIKIEEHLRDPERLDVSVDMDIVVELQASTQDQIFSDQP